MWPLVSSSELFGVIMVMESSRILGSIVHPRSLAMCSSGFHGCHETEPVLGSGCLSLVSGCFSDRFSVETVLVILVDYLLPGTGEYVLISTAGPFSGFWYRRPWCHCRNGLLGVLCCGVLQDSISSLMLFNTFMKPLWEGNHPWVLGSVLGSHMSGFQNSQDLGCLEIY